MSDPIHLFIGLIVLVMIFGLLWLAFNKSTTLIPSGPGQTVVYVVGILILVLLLLWLFAGYVPFLR
jgi:amino acid transporter